MRILMLVLIVFLAACQNERETHNFWTIDRYDVLYIADSNGIGYKIDTPTAMQITGINYDARGFREMVEYTNELPTSDDGVSIIFLALGVNDSSHGIPIEDYTQSLQAKLASTDAEVFCVLPITHKWSGVDTEPFKQAMLNNCTNTINPRDYGVNYWLLDGTHWESQSHFNFVQAIEERI